MLVCMFISLGLYTALFLGTRFVTNKVTDAKREVNKEESAQHKLEIIQTLLKENENAQKLVDSYILSDTEVVAFIEQLEQLIRRTGIDGKIDAVSAVPYTGDTSGKWENLRAVISSAGEWSNTYHFLSLLEQLPYRLQIPRVVIEKTKDESTKEKTPREFWRGEFTLQVLKLKSTQHE